MRLFVYDHCPYCVRARIPFGFKNIPLELIVLANDDEATPISMIGAKLCPILEKEDGVFMGESMDIVTYLDNLNGSPIFSPSANRAEINNWVKDTSVLLRRLLYPRWVMSDLEDWPTESAREYFISKKSQSIGSFTDTYNNSADDIKTLEKALLTLEPLLHSEQSVNESLSLDDIDIFGRLRGVTLIKDLSIPTKVRNYIDYFSEKSGVPTYDEIAL